MLGDAEMRRVQHPPGKANGIARAAECSHKFLKNSLMLADGKTLDVFEHESPGIQFRNETHKFQDQIISGIVKYAMSDKGKSLTGRATKNAIDGSAADTGGQPNIGGFKADDGTRQDNCLREIELVSGAVNGVDLNGSDNIKASLFEAQAHATRTGKQIDH